MTKDFFDLGYELRQQKKDAVPNRVFIIYFNYHFLLQVLYFLQNHC